MHRSQISAYGSPWFSLSVLVIKLLYSGFPGSVWFSPEAFFASDRLEDFEENPDIGRCISGICIIG